MPSPMNFAPGHMQLIEVNEGIVPLPCNLEGTDPVKHQRKLDPFFSAQLHNVRRRAPQVGNVALIYHWRTDCDLGQSS